MLKRKQVFQDSDGESLFLWGARQTGKTSLLKEIYPNALWFDLLMADVYQRLINNPVLLRETVLGNPEVKTIIIDEIQRIPELLNEIHWLMTNTDRSFLAND